MGKKATAGFSTVTPANLKKWSTFDLASKVVAALFAHTRERFIAACYNIVSLRSQYSMLVICSHRLQRLVRRRWVRDPSHWCDVALTYATENCMGGIVSTNISVISQVHPYVCLVLFVAWDRSIFEIVLWSVYMSNLWLPTTALNSLYVLYL